MAFCRSIRRLINQFKRTAEVSELVSAIKAGSKRAVAKWLSCVSFTVIRFIQILQAAIFVSSWQVYRRQGWGYLFANRYCNTRIRPPRPWVRDNPRGVK